MVIGQRNRFKINQQFCPLSAEGEEKVGACALAVISLHQDSPGPCFAPPPLCAARKEGKGI